MKPEDEKVFNEQYDKILDRAGPAVRSFLEDQRALVKVLIDQISPHMTTVPPAGFEDKQTAQNRALAAVSAIAGKVPTRAYNAVRRGYERSYFRKPLNELTDRDLLSLRNLGAQSLAAFRKIIPAPPVSFTAPGIYPYHDEGDEAPD